VICRWCNAELTPAEAADETLPGICYECQINPMCPRCGKRLSWHDRQTDECSNDEES
jgi:hypothetical protein